MDVKNIRYFNKFNMGMSDFVTPGKQLEYISKVKPKEEAIIYIDKDESVRSITWEELHIQSNKLSWYLKENGIGKNDVILVSFPNSIEHIIATFAIWKLGACYMPVSHKITDIELENICKIITPSIAFSDKEIPCTPFRIEYNSMYEVFKNYKEEMPEDIEANPNMISPSGGTTGQPKFIRQNIPSGLSDETIKIWFEMSGMDFEQRQLLVGPLFHGAPHSVAFNGLFVGSTLVIPRNLRPEKIVQYMNMYDIEFIQMIPTLMNRIIKLPDIDDIEFKSLKTVCHTGGYCSPYLKNKWINIIGEKNLYEIYSMTEAIGMTYIRGDEWIKHRGSVGKPVGDSEIIIIDDEGNNQNPYQVGEIYMTSPKNLCMTEYINHKPLKEKNGFKSVGDFGFIDDDGYLYFSDRRSDMFVIGGENVFATEIETVLTSNENIVDAVVVGVHDEEWGRKLYAIVQRKSEISKEEIFEYMKKHLSKYKIPKEIIFISCIPRGENGKLNREDFLRKIERNEIC